MKKMLFFLAFYCVCYLHGIAQVASISGPSTICQDPDGNVTYSDATPGGTWSRTGAPISSIGSATGIVVPSATYSGTATISYTVGSTTVTMVVTVNPVPRDIQAGSQGCASTSVTISDVTPGGTWSSSGDLTVSGTGTSATLVTGATAGTGTFTYTLPTGCYWTDAFAVSGNPYYKVVANPVPITGVFQICAGTTIDVMLSDATTPSVGWTSSNTAVALVTTNSPDIEGVSVGTATITYTANVSSSECIVTQVITVMPTPAATTSSTGVDKVCVGLTLTLSDATSGGTWSSTNTHATVDGSGDVTGVSGTNSTTATTA